LRPEQSVAGTPDAIPAVILNYGTFLQNVFDFFLVALAIFAMVQMIAKLKVADKAEKAAAPPEPPRQEVLLEQILDALRAQNRQTDSTR
jgi:large conductance mechanosensitive channel